MIAGALGVGGAGMFAKSAISEFAAQEKELAKLAAVLKATGNASGYSVKELDAFASELQRTTVYADDTAMAAMSMLSTFKSIKGQTFKDATMAAADLATIMGGDLTSATRMIGRALEDPVRGLTMLRRIGVTFTEEQQANIKALLAAGQLQVAQQQILATIQGKFGGAAAAAADTVSGKIAMMTNKWSDLKEMIGFTLVESLRLPQAMDWLMVKLGGIQEWFAAGHGIKWFIEIEYGLKKAQALLAMFGENIAAPVLWIQENWSKVWANALDVAIAVWQDMFQVATAGLRAYFNFWQAGWARAFKFLKSGGKGGLGGFFEGLVADAGKAMADQVAQVGQHTIDVAQAIRATPLEFNTFADMGDELARLDAEMEARLAKIAPPFAKYLEQALVDAAPEVTPAKAAQSELRFAAAVEEGSLEAYKAALPKREDEQVRLAKESLEVQRKQLAAMERSGGGVGLGLATIGAA